MCFGYVPIFIGGGEGLRVEQRGPVRGEVLKKSGKLRVWPLPPNETKQALFVIVQDKLVGPRCQGA